MIGRWAIVALAVGLASCAGFEPAGRNARSSGPAPTVTAPPPARQTAPTLPPPAQTTPTPAPQQQAAPALTLPPPQRVAPPTPQATQTPPAPQRIAPPVQQPAPTPPTVAPQVSAPPSAGPAPTAPARQNADDDIVVPGQVRTQVPPPAGDPRSNEERRADVRSWDQCVTQVQSAFDSDPMRPQLTTPEEYCAQSLGMADRGSVPISRRQRR